MKSAYITRAFALANLLFVLVGVWIFASMSGGWQRGFLPPVSSAPFARHFYVVDAIFRLLFLLPLSILLRDCYEAAPWRHEQ